ncbi:Short-chain dehydrogenase/reductase SAT3 [Pseudocercospora fuligena]|uniref:Short-chain dehydrogenase/reductase SAT3 n=1 Tax=Pseudocercospora fuligena TaxID=685502 RepID=A0A8H6VEC6_9PEZI|nr:Short-chain dehydrogenase/reductase SAT3 [Pseudocercospora fuligena]
MDPNTVDPNKLFSVKGIVVLITGGGTGIGLMMTKAFASNGAHKVFIVGRRRDKLESAASEFSVKGNIVPIVGDVTKKEDLVRMAEKVKSEVGYLNVLCCNSGVYPPPISAKPWEGATVEEYAKACMEQKMEDWNRHGRGEHTNIQAAGFATNTTAVAFTIFAFLTLLSAGNEKQNCPGRMSQAIVTSSIAGYLRNPKGFSCYPITKGATTHLIKGLSGTLVPYRIRVNGLAPGLFPSDLAAGLISAAGETKQDPSTEGAYSRDFIPAERVGSTADMAGTVLYMAGQAGAYLNGNITVIDGGRISQIPSTY